MGGHSRWAWMLLVGAFACGQDGASGDPDARDYGEPAPLVINELMAKNRLSVADDVGGHADWVELYNPTTDDALLDGWAITDDLARPRKHELPDGLVVPAGGYLLLWLDGTPTLGDAHVGFKLAVEGGELGLTSPTDGYIDRLTYRAQTTDLSAARTPDGSGTWQVVWEISPGAANPSGDSEEPPGPDPEMVPAAGDVSESLLGADVVPELALELSDDAIADLRAAPYEWVEGALEFRGRRFEPIGVRLKGQNSFQPIDQKPSFKVKLDRFVVGAELLGLDDLTLNNMDDDPTLMSERIAYHIARLIGVPSPRANHALVTVNGAAYGLYAHIETTDRRLLARWFDDTTGPLYEATDVDFAEEYIALYEHENGPDDRSALYALADALLLPDPAAAMAAAAEVADLDAFRRFWALCAMVGQFDSFPYSAPGDDYHVYIDPTSGKIAFLPWGMDETFNALDEHVLNVFSVLAKRCLEDTGCANALYAEMWQVLDEIDAADVVSVHDAVAVDIADLIAADPRKPYDQATVLDAQDNMRWFLTHRRPTLEPMIPGP